MINTIFRFSFIGLATLALCHRFSAPLIADDLDDARMLRLSGHYEVAMELYQQLLDQQPVSAALGLSQCYRSVGKDKQAQRVLENAVAGHPNAAELHAELSLLAFDKGDHAAAGQHVDAALIHDENQLLARWIQAELNRVVGKLDEAQIGYRWLVRYYNQHQKELQHPESLVWIGKGAARFARWTRNPAQFSFLANRLYPKALAMDKNYWPALLESGSIFSEKYNADAAKEDFRAALDLNPNAARVHAAMARVAMQDFNVELAEVSVDRALEINPQLLEAHQLKADVLLAHSRLRYAAQVLENASQLNPVDEQTLGRLAAVYAAIDGVKENRTGTRMGLIVDEVTERNPHCGEFFYILASSLELLRKYPQAAQFYAEATRRMPQLLGPRGRLGLMHMRLGEEVKAAPILKESFELDPFNVRVKNMLAVLDVLQSYAVIETEHFVIRFDRGQDEILAKYAARYLEDIVYPEVCERLRYKPKKKTLFEFFSRSGRTSGHGWFSARMTGLPYIGTVGACGGKMVALASPTERQYNWARVLRHEFVHVVNVQQTNFNIPHWFTEALAILHEDLLRPHSWNRILANAASKNELLNLDNIDFGFIKPKHGDQWSLAYCQAELYAQYMLDTYGDDALARMIDAYADNLCTRDALERCFGTSQDDFEQAYKKYVDAIVKELGVFESIEPSGFDDLRRATALDPGDALAQARLAYWYLTQENFDGARERALKSRETDSTNQLAAFVLARLEMRDGNDARAITLLDEAIDESRPNVRALSLLGGLKLKEYDLARAEQLYSLGAARFPNDPRWPKYLAALYLRSDDHEKLSETLREIVKRDYDNSAIRKKLAELAMGRQDFAEATRWATEALHIDVMDAETHAMLARTLAARNLHVEAIEEYKMAIRIDPDQIDWRLELAKACMAADQLDQADEVLHRVLELRPDNESAKQLLSSFSK